VGKRMQEVSITFVGCGAANVATARLLFARGADPSKCLVVDSRGILGVHRADIAAARGELQEKWRLCETTNAARREGGVPEALEGADVLISCSCPGPGAILPEWLEAMEGDAIVFTCANPVPEIWPWEAKESGATVVATGRSDFPNQVNNSMCFPGIFRGALDVRARTITDEMCFAAAEALAARMGTNLGPESILPKMYDWEVFPQVAAAVGMEAQRQGVADLERTQQELHENALGMIRRARELNRTMIDSGLVDTDDAPGS